MQMHAGCGYIVRRETVERCFWWSSSCFLSAPNRAMPRLLLLLLCLRSCSDHWLVDILARFTSRVSDIVQYMWLCANIVAVVRDNAVWKLSRRRFVTSVYNDWGIRTIWTRICRTAEYDFTNSDVKLNFFSKSKLESKKLIKTRNLFLIVS